MQEKPEPLSLRMRMGENKVYEGDCTCGAQVIPLVNLTACAALPAGNSWSAIQSNATNTYYLSLYEGSFNNNNKNNNYNVVLVELETFIKIAFEAEENCWKNKHSSWDAAKFHYHMGKQMFEFIWSLYTWSYKPLTSICFIVLYPKPREVFASHYQDRIAHHIVAPYMCEVAESVHRANGNVSFGNRKKMSSYHACLRLQELMRKHPNGYVASWDIKSFFMSIDRETAWKIFCHYEEKYKPLGYSDKMRGFIMYLIKIMILYDPSSNCEKRSPLWQWEVLINPSKTLFKQDGKGEPIGNYYAQIIANLILAVICEMLKGYDIVEFVDDFAGVADTKEDVHKIEHLLENGASKIKLRLHPTKRYIQPVRHGIKWCGYFIYVDRLYISNRPIKNCVNKINTIYKEVTYASAEKLLQTLNSYFGMMCHCAAWNIQNSIAQMIMDKGYNEYLEVVKRRNNHLVFQIKEEHKRKYKSIKAIDRLDKEITNIKKQYRYDYYSSTKKRKAF